METVKTFKSFSTIDKKKKENLKSLNTLEGGNQYGMANFSYVNK